MKTTKTMAQRPLAALLLLFAAPTLARAEEPPPSPPPAQEPPVIEVDAGSSAAPDKPKAKDAAGAKTEGKPAANQPAPEADAQGAEKKKDDVIEVRVFGRNDDALQKVPGSGTLVGAKEIRRTAPSDTGEILRRVPGVHVRPEEGMGMRLNLGMRGLDPTRSRQVLILEDGIPVAINPYGEPDLYYSTPVDRIRAVEVVKGSGNILFGPQTIGGVVNFVTLAPPDKPEWTLEGQYGQRDYLKLLGNYGGAVGDARYVLQVTRRQGSGFRDIGFDTTDFLGKVSFPTGDRSEATVKLAVYDEYSRSTYVGLTRGMFEADPKQVSIAPYDGFAVRRYDASLTHEVRIGEFTRLRTFVYGYITNRVWRRQRYDRDEHEGVDYQRIVGDPSVPGGAIYFRDINMIRDRHYEVLGIEPRLEHRFATGAVRHTLTAGTRLHVETAVRKQSTGDFPTSNAGQLDTDEYHRTYAFAAFVQDRVAFRDDLLVTPGVRMEYASSLRHFRRVDEPAGDVWIRGTSDSLAFMPGIGLVYGSPKLNFFGGVNVGYSPPRVASAITPEGKDAQLDAEQSTNYELGVRLGKPKWIRAEVAAFLMSFRNQVVTGTLASGNENELVNGGSTLHKGAEVALTLGIGQAFGWPVTVDLTARYTYSVATFRGGPFAGNRLPYAPLHTASATLDVDHKSGFGGQLAWTFVSDQFADENNTIPVDATGRVGLLPAYQLFDVNLRYRHEKTGLGALVTVKNALDQVFVASRLPDGIQPGGFRQVNVGLRWDHK